jgi:gliding motility-associated lipoprotein GldD
MKIKLIILLLWLAASQISCSEDPVPKQQGFHRIEFPERNYSSYQKEGCPFSFEYPGFGTISYNDPDPCWMDIYFKPFHCNWHFTYRKLNGDSALRNREFEEYRRLIYKHTVKATQIKEAIIETPRLKGVLFELYGNVPTSAQLFLTDTENKHALEVSFYFYTAVKNDSLAPVIQYMKEDLLRLAETVRWEE